MSFVWDTIVERVYMGNKTEELILNLILTPFLCHSSGIEFRKVYIREQDIGAHSHSHSNAIPMSFIWHTIMERVYTEGTRQR